MSRSINLERTSRFSATPLVQREGTNEYFFGVWGEIEFPPDPRDFYKVVTTVDLNNWWKLANDVYGDFRMMWVIWTANNITDPFDFQIGTRIRIPHPTAVNEVLANVTGNAE